MKYLSIAYNAFLWALCVGMIAFSNAALQSSINVGYVFLGALVILIVVALVVMREDAYGIGLKGSIISVILLFNCWMIFAGPGRFATVPATFVRDGVHLGALPLGACNAVLALLIVGGFIAVLLRHTRDPKPVEVNPDPSKAKVERTGAITRWITLAVLTLIITIVCLLPGPRATMGHIFALLSSGNIDAVVEFLRSYGPQAALVSALLMVLQSLAAPIPAFIITLSNAVLFGWWQGAILSWSSAMVGAMVCFYIARILGRDAVEHFVSGTALATVDRFFDKYGTHAILICRLLPFMSFDYVSYAAGLTPMKFRKFFIATGIGQAPATIVYSYVGGTLTGGAQMLMLGLLITFSAAILVAIIYSVWKSRNADILKEEDVAESGQAEA